MKRKDTKTTNKKKYHILSLSFFLFLLLGESSALSEEIVLKIGTLAPTNSVWFQLLEEVIEKARSRYKGVKFTVYPGGVMGDEEEMIRKIKSGQLHGGAFTVSGIKKIAPEVGVLDLPFLFKSYKEVDHITSKFKKEFSEYFEKNGFKLISFAEHGFVYFYSKNPNITGYRDLGKTRIWAWKGERVMYGITKILGSSPIYVQVPDVLSALETGMLESLQTSPVACLSLQWCKLMKVIIDYPYRYEPGVVVIYKKVWDSLPEDFKRIFTEIVGDEQKYNVKIREGHEKSKIKLKELGMKFIKPPEEDIKWFEREIIQKLYYSTDTEYPHELLKRISQELENIRR
ncbi:MAG: TRAP transporter substrate-binding protein DctP [Candidatus Calescibacterium sp.]|nr:TRAP transporter substrate-binding protein DctP [Candidatus Calescibacterium sp.]MCX7734414.1 TRAP transporter substrate-binding protein DctP [bacterium]MDW8086820.1 TRAP transporter substrate-binding protein DctP [Candidatus Calescibacterium sp.]